MIERVSLVGVLATMLLAASVSADTATNSGLAVTFTNSSGEADAMVLPNFALYVASKDSPTPFLSAEQFTSVWDGFISVELRSEYFFATEMNGKLRLEINDLVVFDTGLTNARIFLAQAVRLNKGANKLKALFTSPPSGDAFLRVGWTEKGTNVAPVPSTSLTYRPSAILEQSAKLARGRELFIEYRCGKCHTDSAILGADPDAPRFEAIGTRRRSDWMARWILDPKALRATAHMPKILHGENAAADANAIALYLGTLRSEGVESANAASAAQNSAEAKPLFERLHCNACHELSPDAKEPKISLAYASQKFTTNSLVNFLLNPVADYASIRMPNFKLNQAEAQELAGYLLANGVMASAKTMDPGAAAIDKSKQLVQTVGCLNCHMLKLENKHSAPKLSALDWERGCVASDRGAKSPDFGFSAEDRAALKAFGRAGRSSLRRHSPAEFALRQTRALNCNGCHGQVEGIPAMDILGGKLRADWMARFICGDIPYKPRAERHPGGEPWLEARMPGFKAYGPQLADGLAVLHGYPPADSSAKDKTPASDPGMAEFGRKLVGKNNGFSCISCHGVRTLKAMEVFEAEGINLQWSADRLLPDYFRRWMRNPLTIDPQTKMPNYFEDGRSPLTEVLDGDAEKQIDAVWHYLQLRDTMPLPATEPSQ